MLVTRGLERVIGDLTALGYDTKWTVMGAADVGANHQRDRIWIVGKATNATSIRPHNKENKHILESQRWSELQLGKSRNSSEMADTVGIGLEAKRPKQQTTRLEGKGKGISNSNLPQQQGGGLSSGIQQEHTYACDSRWWQTEPNVGRMADGLAAGVDRLKAIGNGQVPLCAAEAWRLLTA